MKSHGTFRANTLKNESSTYFQSIIKEHCFDIKLEYVLTCHQLVWKVASIQVAVTVIIQRNALFLKGEILSRAPLWKGAISLIRALLKNSFELRPENIKLRKQCI